MNDDAKRRLVGGIILAAILIMIAVLISDGEQPEEEPSTLQMQLDAARDSGTEPDSVQTLNLEMPPPREPEPESESESEPDSVKIDLPPPEPINKASASPAPPPKPVSPIPRPAPKPSAEPKTGSTASAPPPRPAAKPAPAPPPPPPAAEGDWAVQVGSFSDQNNAARLRAELQGKGYPSYVRQARVNGKLVNRVRVGPFRTEVGAQQLAGKLSAELGQPVKVLHDK